MMPPEFFLAQLSGIEALAVDIYRCRRDAEDRAQRFENSHLTLLVNPHTSSSNMITRLKHLDYELTRSDKEVSFRIFRQDPRFRKTCATPRSYRASNGIVVLSAYTSEIGVCDAIYLRGQDKSGDDKTSSRCFESWAEASVFMKRAHEALREWDENAPEFADDDVAALPSATASPKLRFRLEKFEHALVFQVLEQDARFNTNSDTFNASNGCSVSSVSYPRYYPEDGRILLRGNNACQDLAVHIAEFESNEERDEHYDKVLVALAEWSANAPEFTLQPALSSQTYPGALEV